MSPLIGLDYGPSRIGIAVSDEGETLAFAGHQDHQLVHEGDSWKIRCRIIRLLDCDQPLGNISFIL